MDFSKVTIITGHYGSGKTNFAVNLALKMRESGKKVTVVDLDIVNPYFRTADFAELFGDKGITLNVPTYANSNVDIPALDFDVSAMLKGDSNIILDVGGDDAGAVALGQYKKALEKVEDLQMLYVVNCYRYLTKEPEEALELMREIENVSLKCTGIVNCSNLGFETNEEIIEKSVPYAKKIAESAGLPLICNVAADTLSPKVESLFPVKIYVRTLWNQDDQAVSQEKD